LKEVLRTDPAVEAEWAAFELRPEGFPALDPNAPYIQRVWRDYVRPVSEQMGRTMNLPPLQPRTRLAHEAAHWARGLGRFDEYHEALFRAFFETGKDIGDPEVLVNLARQLGMDGEALRFAITTRGYENSVQSDLDEAARLEIAGVPAFVTGHGNVLSGVQSVQALRDFVVSARKIHRPE